jgi:single-strand DNA-binding protein
MLNRVVLVGRITHDPEIKRTQADIPVVNFQLAVNRLYAKNDTDQQADFIRIVAWRRQAELIGQYVRKGALIGIDGRLQSNSYDDPTSGQRRTTFEVVADSVQFLESRSDGASASPSSYAEPSQGSYQNYQEAPSQRSAPPVIDIDDDDLPF